MTTKRLKRWKAMHNDRVTQELIKRPYEMHVQVPSSGGFQDFVGVSIEDEAAKQICRSLSTVDTKLWERLYHQPVKTVPRRVQRRRPVRSEGRGWPTADDPGQPNALAAASDVGSHASASDGDRHRPQSRGRAPTTSHGVNTRGNNASRRAAATPKAGTGGHVSFIEPSQTAHSIRIEELVHIRPGSGAARQVCAELAGRISDQTFARFKTLDNKLSRKRGEVLNYQANSEETKTSGDGVVVAQHHTQKADVEQEEMQRLMHLGTTMKTLPRVVEAGTPPKLFADSQKECAVPVAGAYPSLPEHWCTDTPHAGANHKGPAKRRPRGFARWLKKPIYVEDTDFTTDKQKQIDALSEAVAMEIAEEEEPESEVQDQKKRPVDLPTISRAINLARLWHQRWKQQASHRKVELKRELQSVTTSVKMKGILLTASEVPPDGEIIESLVALLDDPIFKIRYSAAERIIAYKAPEAQSKAIAVLHSALETDTYRCAAAELLAAQGQCTSVIVETLIVNMAKATSEADASTSSQLLERLRSVDEAAFAAGVFAKLHSLEWRERRAALWLVPNFVTEIPVEILEKVIDMFWNDWKNSIRGGVVAAVAANDSLRSKFLSSIKDRLLSSDRPVVITALEAIRRLRIVNLESLNDVLCVLLSGDDDVILEDILSLLRYAVLNSDGARGLSENIQERVMELTTTIHQPRARRHCIDILANMQSCSEGIQDTVLWVMRFDQDPDNVVEAISMMVKLNKDGEIDILQEVLQEKLSTPGVIAEAAARALKEMDVQRAKREAAQIRSRLFNGQEIQRSSPTPERGESAT